MIDVLEVGDDYEGEVIVMDLGGIPIRFEPPELRHQAGKHDQKTHGKGGGPALGGGLPGVSPEDYSGGYNPNATYGPLNENDKNYWVAASRDRLQAIRDEAGVPGTVGNKMLVLMDENIPTVSPVYRGIRTVPGTSAYDVTTYKPGQQVDLQLSSFSTSRDEALLYARNSNGRQNLNSDSAFTPGTSALIRVQPGAQALDIGPTFRGNPGNEVITAGRFKVVRVENTPVGIGIPGFNSETLQPDIVRLTGTLPIITLEQVAAVRP